VVTAALDELAKLYPEIATDPQSKFAFVWALAVTSNGLKVNKNFELAAKAYDSWRETGAFPAGIGIGEAAGAINNGLANFANIVEQFGSWEAARDFMVGEHTVKKIEALTGFEVSGEGKSEVVRGAAILGPKIGNGFFSNLYGHFDALTMDRWLVRTVGRWRGTLIAKNPAMEKKGRANIKALLAALSPAERGALAKLYAGSASPPAARMTEAQIDALAWETTKRSQKPAWRDAINALPGGERLRLLGNGLAKYLDGQVEQPAGARERTFLRKVFRAALARLREKEGMQSLTMADLQALLWYPEKLLYESAKKPAGQEVRSYEDDDAPDYANAARALVADRLGSSGQGGRGSGAERAGPGQLADGQGQGGSYAQEVDAPPFYSALRRAVENNPTKRASAAQWLATLSKTPGVKQEEIDWTGLREWLELAGGPVEREGVLAFLDDKGIVIEEVLQSQLALNTNSVFYSPEVINAFVSSTRDRDAMITELGDDGRADRYVRSSRQFQSLWADGTLTDDTWPEVVVDDLLAGSWRNQTRPTEFDDYTLPGAEDTYKELLFRFPHIDGPETHWSTSNVGPHVRFTERRSPVGERVLFFDEMQNDWVAAGEKQGFKSDATPEAIAEAREAFNEATRGLFAAADAYEDAFKAMATERIVELRAQANVSPLTDDALRAGVRMRRAMDALADLRAGLIGQYQANRALPFELRYGEQSTADVVATRDAYEAIRLRMHEAEVKMNALQGGVNDVPFRKTWSTLVMKRMIRYAVDNGFTKIAWINGDQQNGGKTGGDGSWFYERNLVNTTNALLKKYGIKAEQNVRLKGVNDKVATPLSAPPAVRELKYELGLVTQELRRLSLRDPLNGEAELTRRAAELRAAVPPESFTPDQAAEVQKRYLEQADELEAAIPLWREWAEMREKLIALEKDLKVEVVYEKPANFGFDITPQLAEAATGGFPLFQENRGTFTPSTNTISLLRTANLSTFLHEMGHWHLETLGRMASAPDAPADVKADFEAVLAWFGITGSTPVGYAADGGTALARAFREEGIRDLTNTADKELGGAAARAIDGFIGVAPGTVDDPDGASFGLMNARPLEDAYSASPSAEGQTTRREIDAAFSPVREALRAKFGDTVRLYRMQWPVQDGRDGSVNMSAGADGSRNVLSWSTDPKFVDYLARDGRGEDQVLYTEEEISAFEQEFEQNRSVRINKYVSLVEEAWELTNIEGKRVSGKSINITLANGDVVTDTDSVRAYLEGKNDDRREHNAELEKGRQYVITADIPLDEVVWASDRAGQSEFIVRNREDGVFVSREGKLSGAAMSLAQPKASLTPAIRYKGKLYRAPLGGSHFDAAPLIPEADRPRAVLDGDNRVFVTETGKVLDRFKAIDYARLNGLIAADAPSWVATAPELASEYLAQDDTAPGVDTDLPAGRTAIDVWNAMSLNQRRGYHEQFARGFEAYLMEGKAPTTRLRGLFQRFSAWLKAVYRDITRLNVELTDEVRGVMDRLVASSEEIALAEQSAAFAPLLENKLPGMTDDEWLSYQRLGVAATQEGTDELQTRAVRDMKWLANARSRSLRKLQREGADKRAAVRAEVEAEVMAEPVNQARAFLTGPELNSDGTPADSGKLSLPAIKEIYEGNPSVDYARLGYGKGGMLANTGIHHDIVAERFGFPSGDAMLRELLTAEPAAEKIEGLTDQRVLERYGDLTDPAEVEAAALNAIHNDLRMRVLAAEYNALAKATGKPKLLNDAARAYAREAVGRLAIKDLRQERYFAAERKAGRAAMKAMKAGDIELAASHKRAQIINAFAAQAVREAKETVDKGNNLFRRVTRGKEDSVARSRNMDLVNVARAVLERYGVGTPRRSPGEYVQMLKEYDPDLYTAVEPMLVDAMLNAKPLGELAFNDFSALRDLIAQLWTLSRRARQAQIDGKAVELEEISDKLTQDLAARPAAFAALGATRGVTDAERGKVNFLGVRALLRRVEEWAMLQGRSFETFIFRPVSQAADLYRAANADAVAAWVSELEKIRGDMRPAKIAAPEIGYTFGEGNGGVGLSELLGALRHTGNDSNLRKLLVGYGWGRIDENGELDTSRWDAFLARMHREGTLKKSHWDFIQAEWDLHEKIKPQAQRAHRAVYGRYFDEVTAAPVTTPFGTYKGGYVAAAPDNLVGDDNAALRADAENLLGGGSALFPAPARGFTKRRTEEYATKMALDLRLVPRQIDKVLRFAYLAEPVSDVLRILKEKQVATGLKANDPTAMTDLLMPWLRRSATQMTALPPAGRGGAAVDKLARIMRQRTSMALLFANLSNTLQNITGLAPAALRTGKRNMLSATWRYLRDPSGSAAAVDGASVFMANRADRQMEDMRLAIEEIVLNPSPYQQTQEFFARHAQFLQSALQNVLDRIAWMAAYDRAVETGSTTPEADADSVVRTTMGSFSPEDLSRFETGPAWARPLTLFAGYFISQANLNGTEFAKAAATKNVGRGLEVWALGIAVPAIASMMIAQAFRGELGDEDEDGYLDDFLHLFFGGQASYLLAMVPVLGPTINAAILGFNDKPYDDKVSLSPVVSMAESSARVPAGVAKIAKGEGDWSRTIKDSAALATLATGIPFTLLGKPVSYAVDVMEGDIEPEGPVDATRGAITGAASPQSRE